MYKLLYFTLLVFFSSCQPSTNSDKLSSDCDFRNLLPAAQDVTCGYVNVPEDHNELDGKKIKIAYVVLKAKDKTSNEPPVIYLSGGPGASSLSSRRIASWYNHSFRDQHDIILFDQRGIGYSSSLPSVHEELYSIMAQDATEEEEQVMMDRLMTTYSQKCSALEINLKNYNSFQSAKDVGVLMEFLGYESYNLYGVSYGTRLARVIQDIFPSFLNSVILNSPDPIKGDMIVNRLKSYSLALSRVFDYCKNDPECNKTTPSLEQDYLRAINELKKKPIELEINGDSVFLNAQDGLYYVRRLLYGTNSRTAIPALINEYVNGGGPIITNLVTKEYGPDYNYLMWFAVERHEMYDSHNTRQVIDKVYESLPLLPARLGLFDAVYLSLKKFHDLGMGDNKKTFKLSDIPTLITVNQFDPVTPPENGHILMEKLAKGHLYILDEGGHGGGDVDCRNKVMVDFMSDPNGKFDTACLNLYMGKGIPAK